MLSKSDLEALQEEAEDRFIAMLRHLRMVRHYSRRRRK
jgi:PHD/YefM family antitoxin component YafN of YafNO toxin-antitoxin module